MNTRILVVDDHDVARNAICSLLERSGDVQIVGTARGGAEALQAIRELHPDLVLLDLMMPDMDGFEILARLQGEAEAPKVVVLSMNDSSTAEKRATVGGAAAFVSKMRAHRDLLTVIKAVVEA